MAVCKSNTFCSLANTSSLRAWELLSSWEICSSKAWRQKQLMTPTSSDSIKPDSIQMFDSYWGEIKTWIWELSCSIILCCFSITWKEKNESDELQHPYNVFMCIKWLVSLCADRNQHLLLQWVNLPGMPVSKLITEFLHQITSSLCLPCETLRLSAFVLRQKLFTQIEGNIAQ